MNSLWLRETGRTSCEFGGAVLALVALKDFAVQRFHIPATVEWPWGFLAGIGVLLVAFGFLIWIVSGVLAFGTSLRSVVERVLVSRAGRTFRFAFANLVDLQSLHEFYESYFHADTPSVELMTAWLKKCESAFVLEYDVSNPSHPTLVGSFKLLPLNKKGVRDLEMGAVSGSTFTADHLCSFPTRAMAFYVGDLCAQGIAAQAVLVKQLEDMCAELVERGRPIYARPFTPHGRQVMVNRCFVHVSDGDANLKMRQLCRLDPKKQEPKIALVPKLGNRRGGKRQK